MVLDFIILTPWNESKPAEVYLQVFNFILNCKVFSFTKKNNKINYSTVCNLLLKKNSAEDLEQEIGKNHLQKCFQLPFWCIASSKSRKINGRQPISSIVGNCCTFPITILIIICTADFQFFFISMQNIYRYMFSNEQWIDVKKN